MDLDLSGKVALVTGSTMGIGHATALGLARMGASVFVNGRAEASVREAIDKIERAVPAAQVQAAAVDLSTAEGCAGLIGACPPSTSSSTIWASTSPSLLRHPRPGLAADVRGQRHERRAPDAALSRGMLDGDKWGRVVFVSSESAIFVPKEMVHYGVTKSAQLIIARGAAELTKGSKVTVNSVLPGPTWVEMQPTRLAARAKGLGTTAEDLASRTFTERRPSSLLQRYATPQEIANLVCYVCSKASSATNGAVLRADGGIVTNPF